MELTYINCEEYTKETTPNICKYGNYREIYTLTSESTEEVEKNFKLKVNGKYYEDRYEEYDTTINFYDNGRVDIMKTFYDKYKEEWVEQVVYIFTKKEIENIEMVEEY